MNTRGFTGLAGTGKTTRLLRELEAQLAVQPLADGQRVLALTFMHGSRFRLIDRLAKSSARRRFECATFDRFAWELCRRWRSRLRARNIVLPVGENIPDYDATCDAASKLLEAEDVVKWIRARFPVVLIDEFQDCLPVRLAIAQRLHGHVELFVAADDFQNLNMTTESPAVAWLRSAGTVEDLTFIHRTNLSGLLKAATALRNGTPLADGPGFKLVGLPVPKPAASFVAQTIGGEAPGDAMIISPARPEKSKFVRAVLDLIGQNSYGNQHAGPFSIRWEKTAEILETESLAALGLAQSANLPSLEAATMLQQIDGPIARQLARWVEHQRCVMTIHQAKNREFPVVIVLWSFGVPGEDALARRWLYNAVTRAKRRAIVVVEDPKRDRLKKARFA